MSAKSVSDVDIKISKTLSWLLRHAAEKEGIQIENDGFVSVESILLHRSFRHLNCTVADIRRIVDNDKKGRYLLKKFEGSGQLKIKATQGHSINAVNQLSLKKIEKASEIPVLIHGTYSRFLPAITTEGLNRMKRNHIHFTRSSVANDNNTSGFRSNCNILVYIDTSKAIEAGIEFFISENGVVLSAGQNGSISPKFFDKIVNRKTGLLIDFK